MYILILSFVNGDADFVGPFPREERAVEYAKTAEEQYGKKLARWHTRPMIEPYAVVAKVIWR